jgi:1,4-alpha-glucan branching enzyme
MKSIYTLLLLLLSTLVGAQVVTVTPAFPQANDSVTIIFNASQGNQALNNYTGSVWAHTGIIDNYSANVSDWRYLKNKWTWSNMSEVDSSVLCTPLGNNLYKLKFKLRNYYGVSSTQVIRAMGFVFRNQTGSLVAKNANGSDIIIPVYRASYAGNINSPAEYSKICSIGDSFPFTVSVSQSSLITLYQDGQILSQNLNTSNVSVNITANTAGKHWLKYIAKNGANIYADSMFYIAKPANFTQDPPIGTKEGISYLNDSTVRLCLLAPWHDNVFVIGDFNNWEIKPEFMMKRAQDGERYWLDITHLTPQVETGFQYVADGGIRTGDPYCKKIIDPDNDGGIAQIIYPNIMPAYPNGKTQGIISVLQTQAPQYPWVHTNFQKPDNRDLVIYELLIRDYTVKHDYKTTKDSLPYLKRLGVNAVELMPFTEFDGNNGWGYSPNYFTAVDKYYGKSDNLKALIDSLHGENIAVILDVVFNHCFGQSPFAKLWWNASEQRPSSSNPYCNPVATHPYSVGYDFNHDSPYVRNMMDSVLSYWISEFKIDGFRFDLSKGFTQFNSGNDISLWTQYDASRVYNITRMANTLWQKHPGTYVILEHLGDNSEETVLANAGCMLWSKASYQFSQTQSAWQSGSDFEYPISYLSKNWAFHNCVGYAESHDEERLMYETLQYGNATADQTYNTKDTTTALQRAEMISPFLILTPGPKMLWMFEELGYDYSIQTNGGRTNPKPVKWDYLKVPARLHLMKTYAALINLKKNYKAFRTSNFDLSAWGTQKQLWVTNNNGAYSNNIDEMNAIVFCNADVIAQNTFTGFQHTGRWYNYLTGDSLDVSDTQMNIPLEAGEFRVFTDHRLAVPDLKIDLGIRDEALNNDFRSFSYPNPFTQQTMISYEIESSEEISINIYDLFGKKVRTLMPSKFLTAGNYNLAWNGCADNGADLSNACYFYEIKSNKKITRGKIVKH